MMATLRASLRGSKAPRSLPLITASYITWEFQKIFTFRPSLNLNPFKPMIEIQHSPTELFGFIDALTLLSHSKGLTMQKLQVPKTCPGEIICAGRSSSAQRKGWMGWWEAAGLQTLRSLGNPWQQWRTLHCSCKQGAGGCILRAAQSR